MRTEGKKTVFYDGLRFCRDDKTGYYLNRKLSIRLHRYVWIKFNGEIPTGFDIHHIDFDKSNNDIENLQLVSAEQHCLIHTEALTPERRAAMRKNFNEKARPAAIRWHKSKAGSEWHKMHYLDMGYLLHQKTSHVCDQCGNVFSGTPSQRFCCNACKAKWRRRQGLDDIEATCSFCGRIFLRNRYSLRKNDKPFCSRKCSARARNMTKGQ